MDNPPVIVKPSTSAGIAPDIFLRIDSPLHSLYIACIQNIFTNTIIVTQQGPVMKTILLMPLLLLLCAAHMAHAQAPDSLWHPFEYLVGEWIGEGDGSGGQNSGTATFAFDLEKHVLVRKNHALQPAMNGRPAGVHDDLMMIFHEQGRGMRALYVDNESHVIRYDIRVSAAGDTLEFLSERQPGAPRFRLLYARTGERTADVSLDMAAPNAPDVFRHYVTGRTVKRSAASKN